MAWVRVMHIKRTRAKGRDYWYHRVTGERLPDEPGARLDRAREINRGLAPGAPAAESPAPDSLAGTIAAYKAAPEFRELASASRRVYAIYLDRLRAALGDQPVAAIRRRHVIALRDRHADRPGAANLMLAVLQAVMRYAVTAELRDDNPARGVRRFRGGPGRRAWSDAEIAAVLAAAAAAGASDVALAVRLGIYLGQRLGDTLAMSWADTDGSGIRVVQEKTGERLWIPLHRELKRALDAAPRRGPLMVPLKAEALRRRLRRLTAEIAPDLTFHGLRYRATERLMEAGCTDAEAQAITGHRSKAMIRKYGRGAAQRRLAAAAIAKLERVESSED